MEQAYAWVCERRKHYAPDSDVRHLRWRWAELKPHLHAQFGQLHALGAFEERVGERLVGDDVAQEEFPLGLEGVVVILIVGHAGPSVEEVDGLRDVRVPDGPGGGAVGLHIVPLIAPS